MSTSATAALDYRGHTRSSRVRPRVVSVRENVSPKKIAETQPPLPWIESESVLELALRTGVSPLNLPAPCHGFANGCGCSQCLTREAAHEVRVDVKQPWQHR